MGNRYVEDIKKIIGIDPNQSPLKNADDKESIPGRRSIAYYTQDGITNSNGTPGVTDIKDVSDENTLKQNTYGEGSISDGDRGNMLYETTKGVFDAGDIIDGVADQALGSNKTLNGINAVDCSTGDEIEILFGTDFLPPDATFDDNGTQLTSEWTDANTPPTAYGYVEGQYWYYNAVGDDILSYTWYTVIGPALANIGSLGGFTATLNDVNVISSSLVSITYDKSTGGTGSFSILAASCDSPVSGHDTSLACPLETPTETEWPADNKYSLLFKEGKFTSSQYDNEIPPRYRNNTSTIDFCFDGGRTGRVEATRFNGFMIYETSGGNATGQVRVYDNFNTLTTTFDSSSPLLAGFRPA